MSANVSPKANLKAGKTIASVQHVCQVFKQQTAHAIHSDHHSDPSFGKDFVTILNVLKTEEVFKPVQVCSHASYKFNSTLLEMHSAEEMRRKVELSLKKLYFI